MGKSSLWIESIAGLRSFNPCCVGWVGKREAMIRVPLLCLSVSILVVLDGWVKGIKVSEMGNGKWVSILVVLDGWVKVCYPDSLCGESAGFQSLLCWMGG